MCPPLGDQTQFSPGNAGTPGGGIQFQPGNSGNPGGSSGTGTQGPPAQAQPSNSASPGLVPASASPGAFPARAWSDNGAGPGAPGYGNGANVAASVTITPAVTGKLKVTVTGSLVNLDGGNLGFNVAVSLGAGAAALVNLLESTPLQVGASALEAFALVVDLDQLPTPVVLPVGQKVQVNAIIVMGGAGLGTTSGHALQLEVQEVY